MSGKIHTIQLTFYLLLLKQEDANAIIVILVNPNNYLLYPLLALDADLLDSITSLQMKTGKYAQRPIYSPICQGERMSLAVQAIQ